ncbi:3beta-hydroxysteroid dehydrogenase 2 [Erysiphe necator]|uniref:Putative short chain dehydrogenase reductase n=1 Tax=Uncinula necator TaxID=52586 RepID=A0A0B1P668_UNCNE|nr:3beta-hydroxysteroid dehydrogenase 2 [Erysiphe necator]KAI6249366.1 3beta-hydroxysteroid dehydrogenase 2 [Erysiphe necator]KHJ32436.1 putative short chain dehydrogenase reductase [Erysiphe necator]
MSSTHPVFRPGNTAVITGAASGIGLALSRKCVGYNMTVVMVDINATNLEAAKLSILKENQTNLLEKHMNKSKNVEIVVMDVAKIEDYEALKMLIQDKFEGKISLLALNAAILDKSNWADTAYFRRVMDVNLFGVIYGLNTLLGLVTKHSTNENPAAIVITGSKQGITNPPGNPAYNTSKAAIKVLTEHLAFDLSKLSPFTSIHLLIPGWTFTGITGNRAPHESSGQHSTDKPAGAWWPEQVVDYLEQKMSENKFYIVCPDNYVTEALDQARMQWGANDLILGRPPLTRWKEEWKSESESWINEKAAEIAAEIASKSQSE